MDTDRYTAFLSSRRIAAGTLEAVLRAVKDRWDADPSAQILIFSDRTGRNVQFDLSGSVDAVVARASTERDPVASPRRSPGRPRLGVDCGEVCLLPRHWEWLAAQPRGASATLRRLVDAARKAEAPGERIRERIDAAATFLWALAGDLPGFEEASRALYRQTWPEFRALTAGWPVDVCEHVRLLLGEVLPAQEV